jgi:hypothetical protein
VSDNKKALIAAGILTVAVVATLVTSKTAMLALTTWAKLGRQSLDGAVVTVSASEFFFPGNTSDSVLIGRYSSLKGLMSIRKNTWRSDERWSLAKVECQALACGNMLAVSRKINGKSFEGIEQAYRRESAEYVQSRFWIEGSPYVLSYHGPASDYLDFADSIDRVLQQLSLAK